MNTAVVVILFVIAWVAIYVLAVWVASGWAKNLVQRLESRARVAMMSYRFDKIQVYRNHDLPTELQRQMNLLFQQPVGRYIEVINTRQWTFYDTKMGTTSEIPLRVIAYKHEYRAPYTIVRRNGMSGDMSRLWIDRMDEPAMVNVESAVSKDFTITCEPGWELDVMTILSPEVLDVMRQVPFGASIKLRRGIIYCYTFENVAHAHRIKQLVMFCDGLAKELDENLRRWQKSQANQTKLDALMSQPDGKTDEELLKNPPIEWTTKY